MYLRQTPNKTTGRTYLAIAQGYLDGDGKPKQKTIQKIGYLDELEKTYENPVAHFTALAEKMSKEQKESKNVNITLDMNARVGRNGANRKNFGYIVFSRVYHELEIDIFLKNARRHKNFEFNTDAIMRLLVYTRLLHPGSKRAAVLKKDRFFENFNFSLDDVYNALTHFDTVSTALQKHLHEKVAQKYGRETGVAYYDVTNYYFEIDKQDEFRRKGFSKENRKSPIVQMGLLLDRAGLPISYKLFPGNTHDSQTLMPMLAEYKKNFEAKRVIAVADKGLNSGDNIAFNTALGDGYIFSKSVRGAGEDFKNWIMDKKGYRHITDKYKLKSQNVPDAEIEITIEQKGGKKRKKKIKVEQKWVAFYSEKYALRAKRKREETVEKALKMIKNPAKYRSSYDYGAAGYIENLKVDKESGEVVNIEEILVLDTAKIKEEEKYDGYYAVITSELDDTDEHIVEMYHELWRIEDTFKVTKSVLETRPIYLSIMEHINAHFLSCFISLLISRIVEVMLGNSFTIDKITESLRNVACSVLDQNIWLFDFADEVTDHLNDVFGTDFGRKSMTLQEIKNCVALTKRPKVQPAS